MCVFVWGGGGCPVIFAFTALISDAALMKFLDSHPAGSEPGLRSGAPL